MLRASNARQGTTNGALDGEALYNFCPLRPTEQESLLQASQKHQLSARAHHRILKIARTIADLSAEKDITLPHLAEAISLRCLEQDYFQ